MDTQYLCTSSMTAPMALLLDPNITTTDVYTTLSELYVEHDQLAVLWEEADLSMLPTDIATKYASLMGIHVPPPSSTTDLTTISSQPPITFITPHTSSMPTLPATETPSTVEVSISTSTTGGFSEQLQPSGVQTTGSAVALSALGMGPQILLSLVVVLAAVIFV